MVEIGQVWDFLQKLSPLMRSCLLSELERLELCGVDMPGSADIQARLRAEFRKDGSTQDRASTPSRYFFAPLEHLLVDGAPENANTGRIARSSLAPIWEWICRDLLPTMASDYIKAINQQITANNDKEALKVASAFYTKVVKVLDHALASPDGIETIRSKLAKYTASRTVVDDVAKIFFALRARDALAKFTQQLPPKINKFNEGEIAKITSLLDSLKKADPDALPFALTLVAKRLKAPWQLIRLATKASRSKNAADVAATPYAIAVSMALDQLEDKRLALRIALKNNRPVVAQALLIDIYDTEYALRVRIDQLESSPWGERLQQTMDSIAVLVEAEVSRFPEEVGHILDSRRLRSHESLKGRLTYLAWKGRDAVQGGAIYCRKLIGQH
ncbi:MAG: hypothetical protein HY852_27495 [Bradyrhizobium sp.]|uniref:hypothetical protein n=1 Tax=Bradyrhizobium sp. TaxID=376 RepID=UPI00345B4D57|nr:hypothetical protein [Bradyrhizobium sp.]